MPVLSPGKTLRTDAPTIVVENRFEPGAYVFRLVVVDDSKLSSAPVELTVRVAGGTPGRTIDPGRLRIDPTPVRPIRPIRPIG